MFKRVATFLWQNFMGFSKKTTCLRGHVAEWPRSVAEINFGQCLPMSTTVATAARSKTPQNKIDPLT